MPKCVQIFSKCVQIFWVTPVFFVEPVEPVEFLTQEKYECVGNVTESLVQRESFCPCCIMDTVQ